LENKTKKINVDGIVAGKIKYDLIKGVAVESSLVQRPFPMPIFNYFVTPFGLTFLFLNATMKPLLLF
jgi:hypothetical protein